MVNFVMRGTGLPNRWHRRLVELDRLPIRQNVNDPIHASCAKHRREHSDAMAVCTRNFVRRERLRFRAHDRGVDLRCDLDDSVDAAIEILGFWFCLSARLGQMLVADAVVAKQFSQHQSIELRPSRSSDASDVAYELNPMRL